MNYYGVVLTITMEKDSDTTSSNISIFSRLIHGAILPLKMHPLIVIVLLQVVGPGAGAQGETAMRTPPPSEPSAASLLREFSMKELCLTSMLQTLTVLYHGSFETWFLQSECL